MATTTSSVTAITPQAVQADLAARGLSADEADRVLRTLTAIQLKKRGARPLPTSAAGKAALTDWCGRMGLAVPQQPAPQQAAPQAAPQAVGGIDMAALAAALLPLLQGQAPSQQAAQAAQAAPPPPPPANEWAAFAQNQAQAPQARPPREPVPVSGAVLSASADGRYRLVRGVDREYKSYYWVANRNGKAVASLGTLPAFKFLLEEAPKFGITL